ncbi:MAG: bifunctional phosphoribosyl-AMP cyclohydrolase/phosphoribosyl-ATP diphosphatase HisIE [Synergistaceae bacterium]|jgi:phosphoribosyl-ATP pyrophosphohydrolase/phosphoribosyl-AMP cyclohydrolase|nr:bifunctional phosphoribosyl-AMP cyclohydrolase/phosphoribosyl-ATP diphosphatase HisIE [Synergistaceae bacterium]
MEGFSLDDVKFAGDGLAPVVVQDSGTGEVLMVAWANREALELTIERGEMVFWSRSRREIWHKGLTSGNKMKLMELRADCDGDTLLALVTPAGPACHTGAASCFFRRLAPDGTELNEASDTGTFLGRLFKYLETRAADSPSESYTARLLASGRSRVAQKVGEEGVETALALATGDAENFRYEAADLLYHLEVACICAGVPLNSVLAELKSRHKPQEKR